jgi:hypothetical protein
MRGEESVRRGSDAVQSLQSVCSRQWNGLVEMRCAAAAGGGDESLQPLCGQEPLQSVRRDKPVQSMRGEEPLQSVRREESLQSMRGKGRMQSVQPVRRGGQGGRDHT